MFLSSKVTVNTTFSDDIVGTIKVDLMYQCTYRHPASKKHDGYTETFDCIKSGHYYVLGRCDDKQIFTIEYIIHRTDFVKLIDKNIVEVF